MRFTRELPIKPPYRQWNVALDEFGRLLHEYNSSQDVAYWYGERALSGFLSAAAWRSKAGWSLEEFSGLRMTGGRHSTGRGDAWIGIGERTFTVEAKIIWPQGPITTTISDVRNQLEMAGDQLDSLTSVYQVDIPVAVCYAVPELNMNGRHATRDHIKEFFTEVPRRLATSKRCSGSFWYKTDPPEYKGKLYPGVIVVAQFWSAWPQRKADN